MKSMNNKMIYHNKKTCKKVQNCLFLIITLCATNFINAQTVFTEPTKVFLMHSSGNHLEMGDDNGGWIESPSKDNPQIMTFIPDGEGHYNIQVDEQPLFLSYASPWNSKFIEDATLLETKFAIEQVSKNLIKLRCIANNKYLGTDSNDPHNKVFTDKDGSDIKHHWFFSDNVKEMPPSEEITYMVNPLVVRQHFDGWGVSLCWWAAQCGKWEDAKIDEIIDWLVSPTGLNYSHFRYNIGGGDDPQNQNCDLHHMGWGKGLRAEMEGFKDFSGDEYHWERDAAQRKIMLKIKEKRPDAVFEAFSNSCPYYMTYSGCVAGNKDGGKDNLKPEYYEEFAHYLVDVCKHYKEDYGIEFKTLEPFNESVTNYWYANGGQEGCHFDYQSQINFIKVLAPILKESGLSTVISAADETSVGQAVQGLKKYIEADVDKYIGQWNTHTYSGNNSERAQFSFLAHQTGKPLWMSEVGAGGNGIGGNLALAQKLFDDMRYIQPEAWIDWQYMEEANDQWCTIRGNFANQTYSKVKNYYVRQQCSRFIKRGYDIIASPCPQSLAAINPDRDTLVIVAINEGFNTIHNIDLSLFEDLPSKYKIRTYRTSQNENLVNAQASLTINDKTLTLKMPTQSITTLVIPCKATTIKDSSVLMDGNEYLIIPRENTQRAITSKDGKVFIENINYEDAQRWTLTDKGNGAYSLRNGLGLQLTAHRSAGNSSLTAQDFDAEEQEFIIECTDIANYKILVKDHTQYALDLTSASTQTGTTVGTWDYNANTTTPTHRQWMLFPLNAPKTEPDAINEVINETNYGNNGIYDLTGRRISDDNDVSKLNKGVYIVNGKKVAVK